MTTKRTLLGSLLALPALAFGNAADAQGYPTRPVRLVVPFPPGGSTDITARLFAARLQEKWGQPVVVENRPGGDTIIATGAVVQAPADGYTVLLATSALPITAAVRRSLPYDVQRDLSPVTLIGTIPNALVVHPSVRANTVAEFVALAKSRPGALNFASAGASTGQRFAFELLKQRLGIDVVHVPFRGGAPATQAVVAGQVESMIMNVLEAVPLVRTGRLRALAVTTKERVSGLPDVPTLAETVMPGLDVSVWQAAFVPAGSPPEAIARLNRDLRAVAAEPAVAQRLQELGLNVRTGSPEELGAFLREEVETWTRVAREAGIQEN
ncbi:MAG TPA: tripartite tricarboxylate transporter substrate binding protein [Falsiroseomonas sp.]|jgi:tripartite-type tricarboxylate transporter receptor subunit TctC|nr:tripartite tricarboxylate transporter substrate binding protein [Falsiroseomonas sp.]